MNKTLLVGGKPYVRESVNWTATARCRGPGGLFSFQEAIARGATLAIGPCVAEYRAFLPRATLNRVPVPGGNWTTLGRADIDNVSAWQLRPCAHAERQCTRTGERRHWRLGQEQVTYCRCDGKGRHS